MAASWDRRSASEQERLRSREIDRWIDAVAAFSPFWSAYLARVGVDPSAIASADDLRAVPTVRESDVRDAGGPGGPALTLRPREDDLKAVADPATLWRVATSVLRAGPSGKRRTILVDFKPVHLHRPGAGDGLTIAYSRADLDRLHRVGARATAVLGLDASDQLVSAVPAADELRFWGVYHLALAASLLAAHPRSRAEGLRPVVRAFGQVPASAVAVPAEEAAALAAELRDVDLARLRTVITVGPPLAPDARAETRAAWREAGADDDVRVLALWAPATARALWAECTGPTDRRGPGLHTYPDLDLVELVDPAGRPADAAGELTYTSLGWNGTALVRYRTGAHVDRLDHEPCPSCGRTVPRIVGRVAERM